MPNLNSKRPHFTLVEHNDNKEKIDFPYVILIIIFFVIHLTS